MKRDIESYLLSWKQRRHHLPLLVRGARQVGKSYVIEAFGRAMFDNIVIVNFDLEPGLRACFQTLHPNDILTALSLSTQQPIIPGKTLLFLDEIQECPQAIHALRYFKEQLPELHVIGAGSLLEFTLNQADFSMPVGRVESLYLKPLSFKEYLSALLYHDLREYIENISLTSSIPEPVHQRLLKLTRHYLISGGMPGVLQTYLDTKEISLGSMTHTYDLTACQLPQLTLLSNYRQDFGKYAKHTEIQYVQRVFEKSPGLIGEHIKYVNIEPETRSQHIKSALSLLQQAGLIYPIYSTAASGIPLITVINEKKFKILFLDVGLMTCANHLKADLLVDNDLLLLNRGAIAEQMVGQELMAYTAPIEEPHAYFWCRDKKSSQAEIDFIITVGSKIIPIEVKAGSTGRLKSLHMFMDEKNIPVGIHVSQNPLSFDKRILSIPLYMIGEIPRLIESLLS